MRLPKKRCVGGMVVSIAASQKRILGGRVGSNIKLYIHRYFGWNIKVILSEYFPLKERGS